MTDLSHTHIVHKLNRRAEMQEMNRLIMPLLYAVVAAVAVSLLWIATADYRDVAAHRMDTLGVKYRNQQLSRTLARCANGEVVPFDVGMMTCTIIPMVPL